MPEVTLMVTDDLEELLERVRRQENLESIEQAAEWLLKRSIRRGAKRMTGRGRALHLAGRQPS
jgi:hypothetical protein